MFSNPPGCDAMPKQLVVKAGPDQGSTFPLPATDFLLLGRSRAADARLTDPHVSRVHCRIEVSGDDLILLDNDSAGGTFVNGRRINGPQALRVGDVLRVGQTELQLRDVSPDEVKTVPPAARPAAPPAAPPLGELVGQTISRYRVGAVLARGRTGTVFHAHDTEVDRPIALKVLDPRLVADDAHRERFVRAMKTVLPLRHPNLITVYAAGKTGRSCWVAMEYVEGESLTQLVQRAGVAGMLDWRHALGIAVHLARALECAHGQRILHRNVTPMNVLVGGRNRVAKLGDLMLAKALEGDLAINLTEPGELLGDVNYLAPERTYPSATVDERADLFSLGATLYALLTGRPPFADVSIIETIKKIRAAEPQRPRTFQMCVPDAFEGVVMKLLARRPEDRYPSANDLLSGLDRLSRDGGGVAR
jgi:pSer/pThr/pTyr-binding forkhead associated (FHA) protein